MDYTEIAHQKNKLVYLALCIAIITRLVSALLSKTAFSSILAYVIPFVLFYSIISFLVWRKKLPYFTMYFQVIAMSVTVFTIMLVEPIWSNYILLFFIIIVSLIFKI